MLEREYVLRVDNLQKKKVGFFWVFKLTLEVELWTGDKMNHYTTYD